jgi:CheY-like chemotaxis protein
MNKHLGISGVVVGVVIVESSLEDPVEGGSVDDDSVEGGSVDDDSVEGLPELHEARIASESGDDEARAVGESSDDEAAEYEAVERETAEYEAVEREAADHEAADHEAVRTRRKPRRPCAVIVDGDDEVRSRLSHALGGTCQTHRAEPAAALALLEGMSVVDVAVVDCDQPLAVQAPIFRELARWPGALCVLLSADVRKVEQLRALGLFAPLVLDKPVQPEALEAIRSAALELFGPISSSPAPDLKSSTLQ